MFLPTHGRILPPHDVIHQRSLTTHWLPQGRRLDTTRLCSTVDHRLLVSYHPDAPPHHPLYAILLLISHGPIFRLSPSRMPLLLLISLPPHVPTSGGYMPQDMPSRLVKSRDMRPRMVSSAPWALLRHRIFCSPTGGRTLCAGKSRPNIATWPPCAQRLSACPCARVQTGMRMDACRWMHTFAPQKAVKIPPPNLNPELQTLNYSRRDLASWPKP